MLEKVVNAVCVEWTECRRNGSGWGEWSLEWADRVEKVECGVGGCLVWSMGWWVSSGRVYARARSRRPFSGVIRDFRRLFSSCSSSYSYSSFYSCSFVFPLLFFTVILFVFPSFCTPNFASLEFFVFYSFFIYVFILSCMVICSLLFSYFFYNNRGCPFEVIRFSTNCPHHNIEQTFTTQLDTSTNLPFHHFILC